MPESLTEPAKFLLLIALLAKDHIISNNGKTYLKELILRREPRLSPLIKKFEEKESIGDVSFLEQIHILICDEASSVFEELFADTSLELGKTLSKNERQEKNLDDEKSLIYGEVEFDSFYRVLRKINAAPGSIFYDLGSGTGKALFVARMTQDFGKCIGIEILRSLHEQAVTIVERYNDSFKQYLSLGQQQYANVYEGSFLDFDWSNGDVVFANSTCFSDELMADLSRQAEKLKPGSMVVTFTKGMTSKAFEVLERKRYRMSWGPATVFIHRRLNYDGKPVGPARLNILPSDSITYDDEVEQQNQQLYGAHGQQRGTYNANHVYDDDIDENVGGNDDNEDEEEGDDDEEEEEDGEDGEDGDDEDDEEDDDEEDNEDEDDDYEDADDEDEEDEEDATPKQSTPLRTSNNHSTPPHSSNSANKQSPQKNTSPTKTSSGSKSNNNNNSSIEPVSPPPPLDAPRSTESTRAEFAMLNSPLDTALLMRKRNPNKKPIALEPDLTSAALSASPLPPQRY